LALEKLGRVQRYAQGDVIYRQNDQSLSALLVLSGSVELYVKAEAGGDIYIAERGAGEIIGDQGVIDREPRNATVVAREPVTARVIPAEDLLKFIDEQKLWPALYGVVSHRLRELTQERADLLQLDAAQRVAYRLVRMAEAVGESGAAGIVVQAGSLTQEDLGRSVGVSRAAVARALDRFRAEGLLKTSPGEYLIIDMHALRVVAALT
jgi:CRP-like cAMP-binding protein